MQQKSLPQSKIWLRAAAFCGSRVIRVRGHERGSQKSKSINLLTLCQKAQRQWRVENNCVSLTGAGRATNVACPCPSVPWHVEHAAHCPCPVECECRLQQCDWPGVCQVPHNLISVKLRAFFADAGAIDAAAATSAQSYRRKGQNTNTK